MTGRPQRPRLTPDEAQEILRLGSNLRLARLAAGLSQRALGRLTATNPTYLSNVEKGGVVGISVLKVSVLAKALGLSGSQLMGELPEETKVRAGEETARRALNRKRHEEYLKRREEKEEQARAEEQAALSAPPPVKKSSTPKKTGPKQGRTRK